MAKEKIKIKVNTKGLINEAFRPYLEAEQRIQIFFGGSSSGKSVFVVGQRTVLDLLSGGRNFLILRNVARSSRNSTFNEVKKIISDWNLDQYFRINISEMIVTCLLNGYQALFSGLDDVQKLKSITPAKGVITDIIIEEATETKKSDLKELNKRLRGISSGKRKRMCLLFNPIFRAHWIFKEFFQGRWNDSDRVYSDDKILIHHSTHLDNMFLEDDDREALADEQDQYFYEVYTLGRWGALGDRIFYRWRIDDLSFLIPGFDNIRNGLDFGFAADPMAYNRMHFDRLRKKIYIFREEHEHGLTNPDIATILKPVVHREAVACDSAEPKSIAELLALGINAYGVEKGKDSVLHGIQWLQQHEIIIHKDCQETINEFELYQWAKNKDGETLLRPVDRFNHHIDCIRYALETDMEGFGDQEVWDPGESETVAAWGEW